MTTTGVVPTNNVTSKGVVPTEGVANSGVVPTEGVPNGIKGNVPTEALPTQSTTTTNIEAEQNDGRILKMRNIRA